jgi:hypothetical protein
MDWFSSDPDRPGVFSVSQEAYGIFALGQMATGVIAIGQLARGVIAIGQGAVGLVAVGQGAVGVFYAVAMIGVGGRGLGGVLPILPKIRIERFERPVTPPLTTLRELERGDVEDGWLLARIEPTSAGAVLDVDGRTLGLEQKPEVAGKLSVAGGADHTHACVHVQAEERRRDPDGGYREAQPSERVLVVDRFQSWREAAPRAHLEGPLTSIGGLAIRALGLFVLAAAYWVLAGADIFALFVPGATK